ncbi:helix-turn-helix domain-containing protein [Paenibacillus sp. N3/727]|uniref:CdaR family transcriptional regulator n=1 Tax=Paenibacillus sp. N3/727 TaxID=2925845 RepID=UPI001F537E13|nr:sugar diacid recognition domain-containing protein [Paenibacillus sp. N3/727]UNK18240.1 helix-turn-helix domain-containing protein [Paenibacillus sp. N3/727]
MKLSRPLAGRIANEMMNVIPYNINVMDENGTIIGSGDPKRIGTFHNGALKAIHSGRVNEVYEVGGGMMPGVNEPIMMDGVIIGVVGITGHPDEVRPFSKLLKVTVVLLIEQEVQNKRKQDERQRREKFYHELSYRKTAYDQDFLERAKDYGLDLTRKSQAILVHGALSGREFRHLVQEYSHYWNLENDKTVFFMTDHFRSKELLERLSDINGIVRIGVGQAEELAAHSLEQASLAMETSAKINPSRPINRYDDLKFIIQLSHEDRKELGAVYNVLHQNGDKLGLIETLQVYIAENGDHNQTVKRLNIHRNTLNYRLNRIRQLTGKDPRSLIELFELLCGLMWRP